MTSAPLRLSAERRRLPAGRARADGRHHQRRVPRGSAASFAGGGGLFVSEMITSRALVERNAKTMRLIRFAADEQPRSIQLYGVDPDVDRRGRADDRRRRPRRPRRSQLRLPGPEGDPQGRRERRCRGASTCSPTIVTAAVRAADGVVPVTIKMRIGIDAEHLTYREAALRAQDAGVAHVALHGRTAADFYAGTADWAPIAELADAARHPGAGQRRHLGGRRRAAHDARDRLRGRRRRPRLPRPAVAVRRPRAPRSPAPGAARRPDLGEVDGDHAPARRAARRVAGREARGCPTSASTSPGTSRASRSAATCAYRARRASSRAPSWTTCWPARTLTSRSPRTVLGRPRGRTTGAQRGRAAGGLAGSPRHDRAVPHGAELDRHAGG